jgi:hypothetical protein
MVVVAIKKIDNRFVKLLMAIACHAGEYAYAALSTLLRGLMYVGTAYVAL